MTIPHATHSLIIRLRDVAILLDTAAAQTVDRTRFEKINAYANAVWSACRRLDEMATAIEDLSAVRQVVLKITNETGDAEPYREVTYAAPPK